VNNANNVEIVPTGAAAGAEIRGVDLKMPFDEGAFEAIEAAFDKYGVIFLRNQALTPHDQIAFSERFGAIEVNFNSDLYGVAGAPEIFAIGNAETNGAAIALKGVGQTWHTDMCYASVPPRATMLYALEVPRLHGLPLGDTCFANAASAWDALPVAMQNMVSNRRATFDFRGRQRSRPVSNETVAAYPPVQHPIVRTHPHTGRRSLYIMRDDCTAIDGMDADDSASLIAALADHILRPEFIYRHQWQEGDLLMWDNCTVQHRAIADYALPQRRLLHRSTIAGTPPA
jgi:taurine dioxygenase